MKTDAIVDPNGDPTEYQFDIRLDTSIGNRRNCRFEWIPIGDTIVDPIDPLRIQLVLTEFESFHGMRYFVTFPFYILWMEDDLMGRRWISHKVECCVVFSDYLIR